MSLNRKSSLPLHAQVEQYLREIILQREYQQGGLLPDEITLSNQLGVSRGTVRAGVSKLVHAGLLVRKAGVGTRVANGRVASGIGAWGSLTREMEQKGVQVQTFALEMQEREISMEAAQALQLKPDALVQRLDRLRGWNDQPVVHSRSWFHPRLGLKGGEDFTAPLYEVIEARTGFVADHAREEFLAIAANAVMARQLQVVKGAPLLLRRHTVYDPGGRPIEYAEVHYRSDRFALTLELRREKP